MAEKTTPEPPPSESRPADGHSGPLKKAVPDVKDHISRQLRALFDEVASQPVPDRFMDMLGRLDQKSRDE